MDSTTQLKVRDLTKRFGFRTIFEGITFDLVGGDVLGVTGRNGSGKSTLMKIIANVMEHSGGSVSWILNGTTVDDLHLPVNLGFVSPYLNLYTEFTAWEHVEILQRMRGLPFDPSGTLELFDRFGLAHRRNDVLRTFSSGMMQRAKFICALAHTPTFLLLDEPMTNFDQAGISVVRDLVAERKSRLITLIATNDRQDLELCNALLSVEGRKQHG